MKKVLIFSLVYYPKYIGGAEIAIKEKTDRISDIDFHMVTLRLDSTLPRVERIGNVLVYRIGFSRTNPTMADLKKFPLMLNKPLFQFLAAWKALQLHRQYHYDAIWAMMVHSCGVPASIFKFMHPSVPYVLELQEGDPIPYIEKKMRPLWPLFTRAFTSADVVCAISTFLGNWAMARGFKGRLEIIPNAVNTKHFSQEFSEEQLSVARTKLGKKSGDVFLVTTSRLVHKNAVDDVIRAIKLLPENIHFVVFGVGPDELKLKSLAQDLGLEHRVHFKGYIDNAETPLMLKACDIFIRPSRSEGMGISFVEAFAARTPVITTQEGGITDFLFDTRRNPDKQPTGWAVDTDSPDQIAEAVRDILENTERTMQTVDNAYKLAIDKYDWDIIARAMRNEVF